MKRQGSPALFDVSRRRALKLLSGGLALTLASCGKPREEIVPYVDMPERLVPGEPLKFATTLALGGYGRGVLATTIDGRPIKIEGNPLHPASLGATDVFAEAAIMSLYDPDRSKAPRNRDDIATWDAFAEALRAQLEREQSRHGAGLRIVTGRITSPTLLRQINTLMGSYPEARWYSYEPVSDDAMLAGGTLAFGRPLIPIPRLGTAAVVLTLDADPLGAGPQQMALAHGYAKRRHHGAEPFLRLYAVEPDWTLTGASADHRLALHPKLIRDVSLAIAAGLEAQQPPELPEYAASFVRAATADLAANRGRALILTGARQPPEVHALCHWINGQLQAPVDLIEPVDLSTSGQSLQSLVNDLDSGRVMSLVIAGANPAYDTPAALGLADKIAKVEFSTHLGLYDDETSAVCQWHLPLSHPLEGWSDLRAFDGAASIVQPVIRPLYDSRSAHEVFGMAGGAVAPSAYDQVQQTWQTDAASGDFANWWRGVLHDGVIAGTAAKAVHANAKRPDVTSAKSPQGLTLLLAPDPSVWDGCFANNAWLQECPHPFTKDVWGNAIGFSAADAKRHGIVDGDIVEIAHGSRSMRGPARIRENIAEGVISTTLGHGRRRVGAIGNGIGFSAYALRNVETPWQVADITLTLTGERAVIPSTQHQFQLEGEARDLYPILTLAELAQGKHPSDHDYRHKPSLLPAPTYDTYAWAMVIDASTCIGCNACVVACQAENNIPVIGPDEVARGRDMHWLRIDRYEFNDGAASGFQPVPCMHCEEAPCEPVCPVAASVHDGEGLNVQVYNRCIGTRFCQANCPYKVRRFNWFGYADGQEYADLGKDPVKASHNPNVTVRARGVMEKCTYCVQRISGARRAAEKDDRPIADGNVVTACQSACPTRAIHFGDRNNKSSEVRALSGEPHHYALLGHLGTRPRTTYLARLRNPNAALEESAG